MGHRISRDLDFFTQQPLDSEKLFGEIKALGVKILLDHQSQGSLIVSANGTKVSAFHYPYPFVEPAARFHTVAVAGLLDIAAMKIIAITQRGKRRDFVDLYFILQDIPCAKVGRALVRRYGPERINPVHIGKALVYFQDAEGDPDPLYCAGSRVAWEEIRSFFKSRVRQFVLDIEGSLA